MEFNNRKKIIIIVSALLLLLLLIVTLIFFLRQQKNGSIFEKEQSEQVFVPEFLGAEEKNTLGIPEKYNIQVLNRDEEGNLKVYRVIEEGEKPVNPADIEAVSK